ncbi:MAG: glycerophosphodiester phosphodiesterase [Phycisphaeraceae bacterium]
MRILAHRGASGYAPENTFASFDLACAMGAAVFETDVRLTRDGVAVLIHDERVDRTTDGTGSVAAMDWAQLANLDAGAWYGPAFAGERVPRLSAFLERYLGRVSVCLELKCAGVIGPTADALRVFPGALPWMEFTSFEWDLLLALREALPGASVGWLVRRGDARVGSVHRAADAGMAMICPPVSMVTPALVAEAHAAGLRVRTWGARSRNDLAHLIACNVDGTTLNWPDWRAAARPSPA